MTTIGIIGGGQLGRMLAMAAARLNFRTVILEPQVDCPAAQVANDQIVAAYDDEAALGKLAEVSDIITYEFENVPVAAAERLAAIRTATASIIKISPAFSSARTASGAQSAATNMYARKKQHPRSTGVARRAVRGSARDANRPCISKTTGTIAAITHSRGCESKGSASSTPASRPGDQRPTRK